MAHLSDFVMMYGSIKVTANDSASPANAAHAVIVHR